MKRVERSIRISSCLAAAVFAIALTLPLLGQSRNYAQRLDELSESLRDLSTRISPSVVQIIGTGYAVQTDEQHTGGGIFSRQRSTGSGVILSDDGYIMTNAHVIEGARIVRVKLNNQPSGPLSLFEAKVIGTDSLLDLALLKIEATGLTPLNFGNSLDLKQGELVLAFGSPLGMDNSVSMGVVSSPVRQLSEDDPRIYIQTDAPINPGNSGGPLVDVQGRLVGMNTFIFSRSGGSEGIGFAIPSNVVRYVFTSLKRDGHIHRGQIGIFAKTITEPLALAFGLDAEKGVLVEDVVTEGPAYKAGVQVGDVVLSIDGRPLRSVRDLALQLYQYVIGDTVELQMLRDDKPLAVRVAVTEKRDDPERFADLVSPEHNLVSKLAILGITVDDRIRQLLPLRYNDGVLVAALAGPPPYFGEPLREGDVIHAINRRRIGTVEMLRAALDEKTRQPIVLQIEREGSLMFLVLEGD